MKLPASTAVVTMSFWPGAEALVAVQAEPSPALVEVAAHRTPVRSADRIVMVAFLGCGPRQEARSGGGGRERATCPSVRPPTPALP